MHYTNVLDIISELDTSFVIWTDINNDGVMNGINTTTLEEIIKLSSRRNN